ncbi:MAG: NAD(P)-binding protein [Gammaproteobacteria bacterium]
MKPNLVILGSGMGGLGAADAARAAGLTSVIFDKSGHPGGHTVSHHRNGFIFDEGPHVSFTKNKRIQELFSAAIDGKYESINAYIDNYWQGNWVRHPVVTNLYGMPAKVVVDTIRDFVEAQQAKDPPIRNYEDWLVASYGRTYAEAFPMQYTRKYHTTEASNLTTDWVGPRLYQAKLEEVLHGAVSPERPNIHYVQDYRYPTHGGFEAFLKGLLSQSSVVLEHELVAVDPAAHTLQFRNGTTASYERLVSSVPLPDLIPMIKGAPADVVAASQRLACSTVVLVNLGVNRPDVSKSSWTYFYDDEFPFSRVSYPRNYSRHVVPEGTGSIQAEVYFSRKYRPLKGSPEQCIEPVIAGLKRCGVLRPDDKILFQEAQLVPYANIIFDLERPAALATVHGYLDELGIGYCGRYGEWGYLWTDEAFLSGENAVRKVLDRPVR